MKKHFLLICLQLLVINLYCQEKKKAVISIDLSAQRNSISPLIYGQFIEFLGRCIDGGIYEEGSPLSNEKGFRLDVLKDVQALNTPLLRFPGGTVVKIYHWKDGIGPKSQRPKRKNLIWGGVNDNHFGTIEFIEYCREIGAEPFLVVNMSTENPTDASDWVEYCNGTEDSYWANLRRSHGYEEPFNVKYWGIGNEEYAEPDAGKHQNVNKYIEDSWQFVKLMKLQDPSIKLTLVGNSENLTWSKKVVEKMHPVCDFLAIHFYSMPSDSKYSTLLRSVDNFNMKLDSMRKIINDAPARVDDFPQWYRFPPRPEPLKLAIDEWGIWDMASGKGTGAYGLEYPYNWAHALAVGKFLNMFQRNADIIGLATWAQTVNVLAPIMSSKDGVYRQTVYTPLKAFRQFCQTSSISIDIDSPTLQENLQSIDATASVSDNGEKIVLSLLNLSEKEVVNAQITFSSLSENKKIQCTEHIFYTAPGLDARNTFEKNMVRETIVTNVKNAKGFKIKVQPASINFLKFQLTDSK